VPDPSVPNRHVFLRPHSKRRRPWTSWTRSDIARNRESRFVANPQFSSIWLMFSHRGNLAETRTPAESAVSVGRFSPGRTQGPRSLIEARPTGIFVLEEKRGAAALETEPRVLIALRAGVFGPLERPPVRNPRNGRLRFVPARPGGATFSEASKESWLKTFHWECDSPSKKLRL